MDKHIDARDLPKDLDRVVDESQHMKPNVDWLEAIWADAKARGLDQITAEDLDAEIAAYRREKAEARASKT